MSEPRNDPFDMGRKGFESWPFMFGQLFDAISAKSAEGGGILAAVPQVYHLAIWCSEFMEPADWESIEEFMDSGEPPTMTHLYRIMQRCVRVARLKGAWEFKRDVMEESYLEVK